MWNRMKTGGGRVYNKRGKRVSGEGLPAECKVKQNEHKMTDGRRQSVQQENGKRVMRQERSYTM